MGKMWGERAKRYDDWYKAFRGAVEHQVDWELLKGHLPKNRNARVLDAAGGTGRITLPLAKMGYSVTLCDISPEMLEVARQKLRREGVLERVDISECDVRKLRFADESFDLVLCWDGMAEAAKELIRVTKTGGKVSIFLVNRNRSAIDAFPRTPATGLALMQSRSDYIYDEGEKRRLVSAGEARKMFEAEGVRIIDIFAVCGWMDVLSIPEKVQKSRKWDKRFFKQTVEFILELAKDPSIRGMSRHLVLYGEKT
jgi:ubiquinone/menaquinone biosynthesis C-methylase UbiE